MKIKKVYNNLLNIMSAKIEPKEKAGFITLQGKQGELTVPIGRFTDHSVKNARIDSRELDLALFR